MASLFAKTGNEIAEILGLSKSFQGKQIYKHLVDGVYDFEEMTDLPLLLRKSLKEKGFSPFSSTIIRKDSDKSGAVKLALRLEDGFVIECVLLTDSSGEKTACVSSQAGCAMGCAFCRTGTMGFKRNLKDYEIVEQFAHLLGMVATSEKDSQSVARSSARETVQKKSQDRKTISHIVFMGMGEPMANLDSVLSAIRFFNDKNAYNISHRRITISTCGVVPGIKELAKRTVPVKLAVSLVSADNTKRSEIMPVNRTFPLSELKNALLQFQSVSGRRFTFEYCLIHNLNTSKADADKLIQFCRGFEVIVNLIPFNPCAELPYETPDKEEINAFTRFLDKARVSYTIRISRGRGISGACGQLAAKVQEE